MLVNYILSLLKRTIIYVKVDLCIVVEPEDITVLIHHLMSLVTDNRDAMHIHSVHLLNSIATIIIAK